MQNLDVSFDVDEPLRAGLLRVADTLVQNAVNCIQSPTRDYGEEVHLIRVTIKRLRALLYLIRPVINKAVFDRENNRLRTAARSLSFARDSDVARQTLAALPLSTGDKRRFLAAAPADFQENGDSRTKIIAATKQVERDLEQTRRNLHRLRISGNEWNAIEPGLREVYRQCRKRMERALEHGDDEDFHKWRIRVKNLYYELQMLRPAWPVGLANMIADLTELQKAIGIDHDLVLLKQALNNIADPLRRANAVENVVTSVNETTKNLRARTRPLGKKIFRQPPHRFVRELGQHWSKWRKLKQSSNLCR